MSQANVAGLFSQSFLKENSLNQTLGEEFPLCDNGVIVFHWADFHETCDSVKDALDKNPQLKEDFQKREAGIEHLASIPVWIRTRDKVHQSNMFELYEKHIFNRSQLLAGIDSFGAIDISFISATGPFKNMAITECFNKVIYRDFILINIIRGKLPRRDFRIRVKSKVLFEYGEEFTKAQLVHLEQLTTTGLLFSMSAELFQSEFAQSEDLRIILETDSLVAALGKDVEGMKSHFGQYAFNLMYSSSKKDSVICKLSDFSVQSSFDFFRNKKVFLFIPYTKIGAERQVKNIRDFMNYTRELVRSHFQNKLNKHSA